MSRWRQYRPTDMPDLDDEGEPIWPQPKEKEMTPEIKRINPLEFPPVPPTVVEHEEIGVVLPVAPITGKAKRRA